MARHPPDPQNAAVATAILPPMSTLSERIDTAWAEHGDRPAEVAARLPGWLPLLTRADELAAVVRLAVHLYGEHLDQPAEGLALLRALRGSGGHDGSADSESVLRRAEAALRLIAGDGGALDGLDAADRIHALSHQSAALTGQQRLTDSARVYDAALQAAAAIDLDTSRPAARALGVAGNNLAAALETQTTLDAPHVAAMLRAAEGGLRGWSVAGGWLETERAEYMLARCNLKAGDAAAATTHASRCLAICDANDAPAFERFFGHAVLALAQRAAGNDEGFARSRAEALTQHAAVPEAEQGWCRREFGELRS